MEHHRLYVPPLWPPGSETLHQYRLYFQRREDGRFTFSHEYEAADDSQAIRIAEGWLEGRKAELWAGARKVRSWDGER